MCEVSVVFCLPLRRVRIIQKKENPSSWREKWQSEGKGVEASESSTAGALWFTRCSSWEEPFSGDPERHLSYPFLLKGEETNTGVSAHATLIQHILSECESCFYVGTSARHWEVCRGIRHWQVVKKYFRMNAQRHRDLLEKSFREDGHVSNYI